MWYNMEKSKHPPSQHAAWREHVYTGERGPLPPVSGAASPAHSLTSSRAEHRKGMPLPAISARGASLQGAMAPRGQENIFVGVSGEGLA